MSSSPGNNLCVALHGGAGRFVEDHTLNKLPVMKEALDAAWSVLVKGKSGDLAVAEALSVMERSVYFNAGYGGYPNVDGIVLLDVGLMRGSREFVSLVNVRRVKCPSMVAYDMLQEHKGLVSIWTYELEQKLDNTSSENKERYGLVSRHEDLVAPYVTKLLKKKNAEVESEGNGDSSVHGTVGCVVRDAQGALHSGTSTGGVSLKHNGRVGDSPIIGAGVFADNEIGALSTTGAGEAFLRSSLSGFVLAEMRRELRANPNVFIEDPESLKELLEREIGEMDRKTKGKGGAIIVLPPKGDPQFAFNSSMASLAVRVGSETSIRDERVWIARPNAADVELEE